MDPVQALAILSLGAFVTVLVTAIFYIFTVRPRLLEPVPLQALGMLDDTLKMELDEQRAVVERLNTALTQHAAKLEAVAVQTPAFDGFDTLHAMLRSQAETVESLQGLLVKQFSQLTGIDERLSRHESLLLQVLQQPGDMMAKTRSGLETRLDQIDQRLDSLVPSTPPDHLGEMIQAETDKLVAISARLDEWAAASAQGSETLVEHARIMAELDRQLATQAQILQRLDARVSDHTTMLTTAASESQAQAGILDRLMKLIGDLFPLIGELVEKPPRPTQDRLTDIKGIGPVYAGRLYEAGIHTFRQLAAMTPDELDALIAAPKWRAIDAESWIEQARLFASQRDKVESID